MLRPCLLSCSLVLFTILACHSPRGQNVDVASPSAYDTITDAAFPANFPRHPLLFSDSIQRGVEAGNIRKGYYHPYLQIGKYGTVNRMTELPLEWDLDTLLPEAVAELDNYRLRDAERIITERARDAQLLIITEAHTKPEHRVFTRCLLDDLYAQGYRHLGLENIQVLRESADSQPWDSLLHQRGYPLLNIISGIYPSEPEYGNLLRHAIRLGFRIFAYEQNGSSESERDLQQAEHIVAYQRTHPGEKIVCHGGLYHATETKTEKRPGSGTYWMAYHYRQLTGDDPLTVYQDAMNEKVAADQASSPYYTALRDRMEPGGVPQVLVNNAGELWRGPHGDMPFDIVTVTPPLGSTDRRRGWANWSCDGRSYGTLSLRETLGGVWSDLSFPAMVEVRGEHDSPIGTPIYVSELVDAADNRSVRLWKGRYRVLVRDQHDGEREVVADL